MPVTVTAILTSGIRFPTSLALDGSDAMNVDRLHEHFVDPAVVRQGRYRAPSRPGYSIEMKPASLDADAYSDGSAWRALRRSDKVKA
jgi:L-alanine-DL-glutamate epimerase-like enolase superfamily enzyme